MKWDENYRINKKRRINKISVMLKMMALFWLINQTIIFKCYFIYAVT